MRQNGFHGKSLCSGQRRRIAVCKSFCSELSLGTAGHCGTTGRCRKTFMTDQCHRSFSGGFPEDSSRISDKTAACCRMEAVFHDSGSERIIGCGARTFPLFNHTLQRDSELSACRRSFFRRRTEADSRRCGSGGLPDLLNRLAVPVRRDGVSNSSAEQ